MHPNAGQVVTVQGPIEPAALGFTLPHEHIFIQLWDLAARFDYPVLLDDDDVMAEELTRFHDAGGSTVVDLTVPDMGRDPERLRAMSERTGLSIVMGCGWYRAPYYRFQDLLERRSVGELADGLIREILEGAAGTGIRPGVIGEIGVHRSWVQPIEERALRAAARAQIATGLGLITHSPMSDVGLAQVTILEEERVDPNRIVIGHADSYPHLAYHLALLERGVTLAFDNVGSGGSPRMEDRRAGLVRDLVERGYADRLLISQDVCIDSQLHFNAGHGYLAVSDMFLPKLRELGVTDAAIATMTVENPRRWLTIG